MDHSGAGRALIEAATAISARAPDLDAVLDAVADQTRRLLGADGVSINLADRHGWLVVRRPMPLAAPHPRFAHGARQRPGTLARMAIRARRAVFTPSYPADERLAPHERAGAGEMVAAGVAPLFAPGDDLLGLLYVGWKSRRSPTRDQVAATEALATHAAAAVRTSRLVERARAGAGVAVELARRAERDRIAMDVHDGVLGTLAGALATLGAGERLLRADVDRAAAAVASANAQVREAATALRAYVYDIAPSEPPRLRAGLAALAAHARAADVAVDVDCDIGVEEAERRIGPAATADLLLVAGEAFADALRHGDPDRIVVRLRLAEDEVSMTVTDDGRGFDPAAPPTGAGRGLANTAARARRLGGDAAVTSAVGRGTTVRVTIPLGGARGDGAVRAVQLVGERLTNALTVVILYGEMLAETGGAEQKALAEALLRGVWSASGVLEDLRRVSRGLGD